MGKIIFYCYNKRYIILITFFALSKLSCFAQEYIDDITKVSFEPLKENETLEWEYYDYKTSAPYYIDGLNRGLVLIYKMNNSGLKENIIVLSCNGINKINNKIFFCYAGDLFKINSLYVMDGSKGGITDLNIKTKNASIDGFCISSDENYFCYSSILKVEDWGGIVPGIDLINLRTGAISRYDFTDTFLADYHIGTYDDIRIMYMENRFYIEFLENEVQANRFDGYIDLFDRQFHLTLGNPNGYKNPPLDLTNFVKTHISLDNLNLRSWISIRYKNIIYTVPKGEFVQVLKTEKYNDSIDGISAPWVKVLTEDGHTGWCFSGYLEPVDLARAESKEQRKINGAGSLPLIFDLF
jgi:hypothetical protein